MAEELKKHYCIMDEKRETFLFWLNDDKYIQIFSMLPVDAPVQHGSNPGSFMFPVAKDLKIGMSIWGDFVMKKGYHIGWVMKP